MNRAAIAFSSKDRPELTRRTIQPLLNSDKFDLWWIDGSKTDEGRDLLREYEGGYRVARHVTGGSCRAIVYALTHMLKESVYTDPSTNNGWSSKLKYTHVGLVENDVLLDKDWFERTMELFEVGTRAGLDVGAVSARTYVDRVLIQRDGYAVMHNIGAGMQVFTRRAAELILQQYRTGMTTENRRAFSALSGIDIGGFWAFQGSDHMLVSDWTWDHMLVKHGMCSLALTPAKATQLEDIAAVGLEMATAEVEARHDDRAFSTFRDRLKVVRNHDLVIERLPNDHLHHGGAHVVFPHQLPQVGGSYDGDWRFKWSMAYGCFAWRAGAPAADEACSTQQAGEPTASLRVPVLGPCDLLVSGGQSGGRVRIVDPQSGFEASPELYPEGPEGKVLGLAVPGGFNYREIELTALTPGVTFYGLRARHVQPSYKARFDFSVLPSL